MGILITPAKPHMQRLIDSIRNTFANYHPLLNDMFRSKTKQWDTLFESRGYNDIHRAITSIVQDFLSNSEAIQLFIQLPTKKLGRTANIQDTNLEMIQKLFLDLLYLSAEDITACPPIEHCSKGQQYYAGNCIWNIMSSRQTECGLRPSDPKRNLKTSKAIEEFDTACNAGIKVQNIELNYTGKLLKKLEESRKIINEYRRLPQLINNRVRRIALVGRNWGFMKSHPITNHNIPSNIDFYTNCDALLSRRNSYDVIILLWDKKYEYYENELKGEIVRKRAKKIIYLGSDIFESFHKTNFTQHFAFTYREIFTYYNTGTFPKITFNKLDPSAVVRKFHELEEHIPQNCNAEEREKICKYIIWNHLMMNPTPIDIDKLTAFLNTTFPHIESTEFEQLISHAQQIECNTDNPKSREYSAIPRDKFLIVTGESFKNRLKTLKNTNSKIYVIDSLLSGKRLIDEIIKPLLDKGRLGEYRILSYNDQKYLMGFFQQEIDIYKRRQEYTGLAFDIRVENDTPTTSILDRLDATVDSIEDMFGYDGREIRTDSYLCEIEGETDLIKIDGHVIGSQGPIKIDEIHRYKERMLPCRISYYKRPASLQSIMELYYDFPNGISINTYSELWKRKIVEIFNNQYNGDIEEMLKVFKFLSKSKLKSFLSGRYTPLFPDEIRHISDKLLSLNAISEEEYKRILNSSKLIASNSAKAKELKESLITYLTTNEIEGFLEELLENAEERGIKTDAYLKEIIDESIVSNVTLLEITKISHNNQNNN